MRTPSDNYLFAGVVGSGGLTTGRSVLAIASTAVVVGRTVGVLVVVATIAEMIVSNNASFERA